MTQWLVDAYAQLRENTRLRLGVWVTVGIVWLYGVLWGSDQVGVLRQSAWQSRLELDRQRAVAAQTGWPGRAEQAQRQLEELRAMTWVEAERGLAEAALQDWVSGLAAKTGLHVRERALLRADVDTRRAAAAPPAPAGSGATALPQDVTTIRMRLVFDFDAGAMSAFLSELAQSQRIVRVDHLRILTTGKPGLVDVELAAVARIARRSPR